MTGPEQREPGCTIELATGQPPAGADHGPQLASRLVSTGQG